MKYIALTLALTCLALVACDDPKKSSPNARRPELLPTPSDPPPIAPPKQEGGKITMIIDGNSITRTLSAGYYGATEAGLPDIIDLRGEQIYVAAEVPESAIPKEDDKGEYFKKLLNKPFNLMPAAFNGDCKVTLPDDGECVIKSGKMTLKEHRKGTKTDWWKGTIDMKIETASGEKTVKATFESSFANIGGSRAD
jgi:hypothetical protein